MKQSFDGTDDELKITAIHSRVFILLTMFALHLMTWVYADAVAGFSVGEMTALAYVGAYSYIDGFKT